MSNKMSRNPFFNFIRSYSCRHTDWPVTKIAVEGARLWHSMCPSDRVRFIKEAEMAKKKKQKTGSILKKYGRSGGKTMCNTRRGRRGRSKSRRRRSRSRRRR